MARLRPFRGLRYSLAAGDLPSLLAPPSATLTPAERDSYAARSVHNAVHLAYPEGHGDDRSKFVRYARAAARLAEWRRGGVVETEPRPTLYRVTQHFGPTSLVRTVLIGVVESGDARPVEAASSRVREDRLRLLEATRTVLEPSVGFYEDPDGTILRSIRGAAPSAEASAAFSGVTMTVETLDDPEEVARIVDAFRETRLGVADNVEGFLASAEFAPEGGGLVALVSLDEPSFARLAAHRVVRRLPGGVEAFLARLGEIFEVEEHHSRNLILHLDRASDEGRTAFGLATEGGMGHLLTPRHEIKGATSIWLQEAVLGPLLNLGESDPTLLFTDPVQAIRVANEGAAAALIVPRPGADEVREAERTGVSLPAGAARTYPAIPTGLVFRSLGDDA